MFEPDESSRADVQFFSLQLAVIGANLQVKSPNDTTVTWLSHTLVAGLCFGALFF